MLAVELGAGQGGQKNVANPNQIGAGQGGNLMATWQSIAALAGTNAKPEELQKLDERIGSMTISQAKRALCIGLMSGLQTRFTDATSRGAATDKMPNLQSEAKKLVMESRSRCLEDNTPIDQKLQAIALLRWEQLDDDISMLANLMDQRLPQPIQEAAMKALMQYQSSEVSQKILNIWPSLSPRMRLSASDVILSRSSWIEAMLERAGQGGFALTDLDPSRLANLRNQKNAAIQQKLATIMKSSGIGNRQEVVDRYQAALTLAGDKSRGKQIFVKSCAACHRLEGVGYELAPNIAAYKFRGPEAILQNVLEPNREVNPQYITYTVITNDERIVTGIISNESETSVTLLRGENGSEIVPRSDISEMKSSKMSLMPEGLESQIDLQGMSDLIAYVLSLP